MSESWVACEPEKMKDIIKQDRFKLTLVVTEDLAVYRYTNENKEELSHLGVLGFSFDPEKEVILYWVRNSDDSYCYREVADKELFNYHPHYELFGKRVNKSLGEALRK